MASETGSPESPTDFRSPRGESIPHQQTAIEAKLQLTREEIRALKECNRESFWYRCVPFSITFATATHLAVQRGLLSGHPTRGALGKNLAAIAFGYFLGKWSYQGQCRAKILALENSPLAESLRKQQQTAKRGGSFTDVVSTESSFSSSSSPLGSSPVSRTDDYQNNEINTDSNVTYMGLDDNQRPNIDTDTAGSPSSAAGQQKQPSYTSYEDLRKKNREDYVIRNTPSSRAPSRPVMMPPPDVSPQPVPSRVYSPPDSASKRTTKNQYGDVWSE